MRIPILVILTLLPLSPPGNAAIRVAVPLATGCDFPVFDKPLSLWLPLPETAPPPLRCRIRAVAAR